MKASAIERAIRKWAWEKWHTLTPEGICDKLHVSRAKLYRIFGGEASLTVDEALNAGIDLAWLQQQLKSPQPAPTQPDLRPRYARRPPAVRA